MSGRHHLWSKMATVTNSNITFSIEAAAKGRRRELAYGSESASLPYVIIVSATAGGTSDLDTIEDWILPASQDYLASNSPHNLTFTRISSIECHNADHWVITAEFESRGAVSSEPSVIDMDFDTTGGSQHIVVCRDRIRSYGDTSEEPPIGLIGYDQETGDVAGVDIPVPQFTWSVRRTLKSAVVSRRYIVTLFYMTGSVNSDDFHGFDAGTTLFLGASGRLVGGGDWDITYRFSSLPNAGIIEDPDTGVTISDTRIYVPGLTEEFEGDFLPVAISKKGWEYLWLEYVTKVDPAVAAEGVKQHTYKVPVRAHVDQVLPTAAFSALGI